MSQILSFKIRGGEEIVAELVDVVREGGSATLLLESQGAGKITGYKIRRPHILQFQPVAPGRMGLVFVPWTLSNPTIENMVLPADEVILTFDPSAHVERQYLEQTSGLDLTAKPATGRIST